MYLNKTVIINKSMNKYIKSVSIILQRSNGQVLLCKRNTQISFFGGYWVFPGGKIEDELSDDWSGQEREVHAALFREMYEEIGILPGVPYTIPPERRKQHWLMYDYNAEEREKFRELMIYIGKKRTPQFRPKVYNAAYYYIHGEIVDNIKPQIDGGELVDMMWIHPKKAVEKWSAGNLKIPPPNLHILRSMAENIDKFIIRTLAETELPIGLQTRIEFVPGIQTIPFLSNTIPPFHTTNSTLIKTKNGFILIDAGAKNYNEFNQVITNFPILAIIITHHHRDHWDALNIVEQEFPNIKLYAHLLAIDRIKTNLETVPIIKFPFEFSIDEHKITIIHTPGHTDDSISIIDKTSGVIVAGDHVVGYGSAVLDPKYGDMMQYMQTTDLLIDVAETINAKLIIPSHGAPVESVIPLLKNYKKHREQREKEILDAYQNGAHTTEDIVKLVYRDVPIKMWKYAVHNIELHLNKLKKDGKI